MESKWFVIILMALSFLYRQYQKNNEDKKKSSKPEKEPSSPIPWNVNELVSQFEANYGGKKKTIENPKPTLEEESIGSAEFAMPESEFVVEDFSKYSEEAESHQAFWQPQSEKESILELEKDQNLRGDNIDLEQLIISSAILNRPEH